MNVYYLPSNSPWVAKAQQLVDLRTSLKTDLQYASAYHHDPALESVTFSETGPVYIRQQARPVFNISDPAAKKVATVKAILTDTQNGKSICQQVQELNLDQVWLWADTSVDSAPQDEFTIVNPTSNYGISSYKDICGNSKSFVLMGYAMNVPLGHAIHSFGHYMETFVKNMQGQDLVFGRFEAVKYNASGESNTNYGIPYAPYKLTEACGNIHVPPNIPLDLATGTYKAYDYLNNAVVNSACDNWKPDGTGAKTSVTSNTWTTLKMPTAPVFLTLGERYFVWWMQNFADSRSGLTFNGKPIPSWWSFVADTDNKIRLYLSKNYWMNPDLVSPVDAATTAYCTSPSGTTSTCDSTVGSTLGASTENKEKVLATTTYANFALVSVGWGGTPNVSSVTYCGQMMTRIGTAPSNGGTMKTDLWYKLSPPLGTCPVVVKFTSDPGHRVVSSTIFNNIDQVTPIASILQGGFSGTYTATPYTLKATLAGPKDSLMLCAYSHYSEQTSPPSPNYATAKPGTKQLWKFQLGSYTTGPTNVWAGLGAGVQRTLAGQTSVLSWGFVKTQPMSYFCINVNVKPLPAYQPATPVPLPPPPVVTATVNLKGNNLDGPVSVVVGSPITLTWTTTGATSCTASGGWTGTRATNGTFTTAAISANTSFSLSCNGANDTVSVTVVSAPTVDVKVGGLDGPITVVTNGFIPFTPTNGTISWTSAGTKSCTGMWSGMTAAKAIPLSGSETYLIDLGSYRVTCIGTNGVTVSDVVKVVSNTGLTR
jgi:hypothetical protein